MAPLSPPKAKRIGAPGSRARYYPVSIQPRAPTRPGTHQPLTTRPSSGGPWACRQRPHLFDGGDREAGLVEGRVHPGLGGWSGVPYTPVSQGRAAAGWSGGSPGRGLACSGDLELLVAEVGDEIEGPAEGGDVAVQDVLGGDVTGSDLRDAGDRDAHAGGHLFLGRAATLRISATCDDGQ